jgi:hypothetical protein
MDCKKEGKVKVKREEEREKGDGEEREQEGHVLSLLNSIIIISLPCSSITSFTLLK